VITGKFTRTMTPTQVRTMVQSALMPVIVGAGQQMAADWQRDIPHRWPGHGKGVTDHMDTRKDIKVLQPTQTSVSVSTGSISGMSLETGAKAHDIKPRGTRTISMGANVGREVRGAGMLAWPESRGGATMPGDPAGWRLRFVAHHPGVHARYYGLDALRRQGATLPTKLRLALLRIP
jgi:hypothetical protein